MTTRPSPFSSVRRRTAAAPITLAILVALAVAACGGAGASEPPGDSPMAAPTVLGVDGLTGSLADLDSTTVTIEGFLLISGDRAQLCAVVLESLPPQCGGLSVDVHGEVPQAVLDALDRTTDPSLTQASWGDVRITGTAGTAGDGTPTITIDTIENVAP